MIRAAACNAWAAGVDGIYINQWYHMWPFQGDFYEKLREVAVITQANVPYLISGRSRLHPPATTLTYMYCEFRLKWPLFQYKTVF